MKLDEFIGTPRQTHQNFKVDMAAWCAKRVKIEEYLFTILPERYAHQMTHHCVTPIPDYITDKGDVVSAVQWKHTQKRDFQLYAKVNNQYKRYSFKANSDIADEILLAGGKHMSVEKTHYYVEKYVLHYND